MIDMKKLFLESWGKCTYDFQPSDKIRIFTIETKSLNYVQGTRGILESFCWALCFFFPPVFRIELVIPTKKKKSLTIRVSFGSFRT